MMRIVSDSSARFLPMLRRYATIGLAAAILFHWQASAAFPHASPDKAAVVTVGSDTGMAGGAVLIPISLKVPDGIEIGNLSMEIVVPEALVKLKGVRPGLAMDIAGTELKAELKSPEQPRADKNSAVIRVTIAAKKHFSPGTLATLDMRIGDEVGDTASIRLKAEHVSLTTSDGKSVANVQTQDGEIKISKSPPTFVNCFFFSH